MARLFSPKKRVVDWSSVKAIDVDEILATENPNSVQYLEDLYDMIVQCAPLQSVLKKDILQLFRVTQLLLELKAGDADELAQQLEASQRSTRDTGQMTRPSTSGDARLLQRKVEQLQLELRHKTESLELAQQDIGHLTNELEVARHHSEDLEAANKNLLAQLDSAKANAEATSTATEEAAEVQGRYEQQLQAQAATISRLEEALQEAEASVKQHREQLAHVQSVAAEDEQRTEAADARARELAQKVSEVQRDLDAAIRDRDAALAHVDILSAHVADNTAIDTRILTQVDTTVKKWQQMLGEKDAEIVAAREVMNRLQDELVKQRQEAGREMEELRRHHALQIEELQDRGSGSQAAAPSTAQQQQQQQQQQTNNNQAAAQAAEERAAKLQRQLEDAQEQATQLRARMRLYEQEYGLSDAVKEIEDLGAKVRQQDEELGQRTREANDALRKLDRLLDENEVLRERAGVRGVGTAEIDRLHAERREKMERLVDTKARLENDLDAARTDNAELRQKLRKYATMGRVVDAGDLGDDSSNAENDVEVGMLQRKLQETQDHLSAARSEADDFRRRWTHAQDVLSRLQKSSREAERRGAAAESEARLLKAALYQVAQEMNNLQFYINSEGDLNEYTVNCPAVQDLLAFYNQRGVAPADSSAPSSFGKHSSSTASTAATAAAASAATPDLLTLYQSDILSLRTAKSELARALQTVQTEHRHTVAELERFKHEKGRLEEKLEEVEKVNAELQSQQWLQLPVQLPPTGREVVQVLNEQLLETLHELDKKQEHISSVNRQLLQLEQQYAVFVKQKDLLYHQHNESRKQWEEEKRELQQRVEEAEHAKIEANQWKAQLNEALETIAAVKRGEERPLLSTLTRKISRLRVNNAALERRYKLALAREEAAQRQLGSARDDMRQCETAARVTIDALKQKLEESRRELYECTAQLEQSVPTSQLDSLHTRCETLAGRYQRLLQQHHDVQKELSTCRDAAVKLVQAENTVSLYQREVELLQDRLNNSPGHTSKQPSPPSSSSSSLQHQLDRMHIKSEQEHQRAEVLAMKVEQTEGLLESTQERCSQLDQKLEDVIGDNMSLKEQEAELLQTLASRMHLDEANKLREELKELKDYKRKAETEMTVLKRTADIALSQADAAKRIHQTKEEELHRLRTQLMELQVEDDDRLQIGRLSHQLLAAQMAEAEAVRKLEAERRKSLALQREVQQLQMDVDSKHRSLLDQSNIARQRLSHLTASLHTMRTQYAGAVTLHQQEQAAQALQDVLDAKRRLEEEVAEAKRQREEAQSHVDALRLQQEHLKETMAALGDSKAITAQMNEWQQRLTRARLQTLQLQRRVHDLEAQVDHLTREKDRSKARQAQLDAEAVEMTRSFEQRETAWLQREEQLEKWLSDVDQRMQQQTVEAEAKRRDDGDFLPDGAWPIGQQLSHAIDSIKRLLQERSNLREETTRLSNRIQDLIVEAAEANAATRHAEAKAATRRRERDGGDDEEAAAAVGGNDDDDDEGGNGGGGSRKRHGLEDASLRYQLDRVIKVSQQTISSLQTMLDARERALDEAHEQLDAQYDRHMQEKQELEKQIKDLQASQTVNANLAPRKEAPKQKPRTDAATIDALRAELRRVETDNELLRQDTQHAQRKLAAKEKDLLGIKRELVGSLQDLEAEFRGVVEERDDLETKLQEASERLQQAEGQLHTQEREAHKLRKSHEEEAATMRSALERSQRYIDALSQPGSPKVTMETLRKRLAKKSAEANRLQALLAEVKMPGKHPQDVAEDLKLPFIEKAQRLEKERDELSAQLKDIKSRASKAETTAARQKEEIQSLRSQLEAEQKQNAGGTAISSKYERDLKRTKGELEAARKRNKALEQQLKATREQSREARAHASKAATTKEEARKPSVSRDLKEPTSQKWEADKKLQKRVENLRAKLATKEEELGSTTAQVSGLRSTIERLQRERNALQRKNKALEAAQAGAEDVAGLRARCEQLEAEKVDLRRQVEVDANVRVMELQAVIRELEAKIARGETAAGSAGPEAQEDGGEGGGRGGTDQGGRVPHAKVEQLEKHVLELKAANLQLQLQVEQSQVADVEAMRAENTSLREKLNAQEQQTGAAGTTRKGAVEASELQRLRKLQRQLRSERDKANERAAQAEKDKAAAHKEYEEAKRRLEQAQQELTEKEKHIKQLQSSLEGMAANEERLQARAGLPAEVETRLQDLEEENNELRSELAAFDPEFFEEIETLKYEHQQAREEVQRLRQQLRDVQTQAHGSVEREEGGDGGGR